MIDINVSSTVLVRVIYYKMNLHQILMQNVVKCVIILQINVCDQNVVVCIIWVVSGW